MKIAFSTKIIIGKTRNFLSTFAGWDNAFCKHANNKQQKEIRGFIMTFLNDLKQRTAMLRDQQTMTELEQYVKSHFEIIRTNELSEVCSLFQLTTLKKGDYFLKEGKRCDKFCFIKTGYLRVFAITDGNEVTQWIATGGHFGTDFSSFFFNLTSRWTIQALDNTELFIITKENYNKIGELVSQWAELERTFLIKCLTMMESRIHYHLSMSAEERYRLFFENNKALFNQVPLQYIASMLGMTPETFSRIRRKQLKQNS